MERQKKVVDASIVLKWFINEIGSEDAVVFLQEHVAGNSLLIAPDLLFLEVLNVLRFKKKNEKELLNVLKELQELQLHIQKITPEILEKTIHFALQYNLTIYDALYVATATIHGAPLITDDKEILKVPSAVALRK